MARGRRVNSNGERSKQLLLEKAMELFSTYGYHQTKISDIVKSANLTQPTFYLYFQSKEALFNDINEQFQEKLLSIMNNNAFNEQHRMLDISIVFKQILINLFAYFMENPKLTKIGFYESEQALHIKNQLVQQFTQLLDNQRSRFGVEVSTLAQSLLGSIERLTLSNLLAYESNPEKLANDIISIYFVKERQFA